MIVVLLIMFIFGGESIRGFIAMLVGIIVGTYLHCLLRHQFWLIPSLKKIKQGRKAHQEV
jgi:SecD/SecF fusion protein